MDKIDVKCKIINFDFPNECGSDGTKTASSKRQGFFNSSSTIKNDFKTNAKDKNFFVFGKNSKQKEFKSKRLYDEINQNSNSSPKKLINTRYDIPIENLEQFGDISKIENDDAENFESNKKFMQKEISMGINISKKFLSLDDKKSTEKDKFNKDNNADMKSTNKVRSHSSKIYLKSTKNSRTLSKSIKNQVNIDNKVEIYGEKKNNNCIIALNKIELLKDSDTNHTKITKNLSSSKPLINQILKINCTKENELLGQSYKRQLLPFKIGNKSNHLQHKNYFQSSDKKDMKTKTSYPVNNKTPHSHARSTHSVGNLNQKSKNSQRNLFIQEDLNGDNASLPENLLQNENSFENLDYNYNTAEMSTNEIAEIKLDSNLFKNGENSIRKISDTNLKSNKTAKNKNSKNLFSTDNIIDTIQLISHNPNKFKHTNQILRSLGQLTANNYDLVKADINRDEKVTKALKDFEEAERNREIVLSKVKQRDEMMKRNDIETKENKKKTLENRKSLTGSEKRNKLDVLITSVKEESKVKKSFDINKLPAGDREVLTRKSPCLYELEVENLTPDCAGVYSNSNSSPQNKSFDAVDKVNNDKKINCDELLKRSANVVNKSVNARKIIENVIERIETNNQILIDNIESHKSMNGFKLKAYTNLFKKGKNLNIDKLKKKKFEQREINVGDMYDEMYLKEDSNTKWNIKPLHKEIKKKAKGNASSKNFENSNKSQSNNKYFHPFLADD